ncbi:MAG: hypothetical protein ACI4R9_00200 [Kiritimatiellia bacterium]
MIGRVLLLAAALSAGNAEFDRHAAEGAARITFARARRELVTQGVPEDFLRTAMLAEPARFTVRSEAEHACRTLYIEEARRRYRETCAQVRRDLALPDTFAVDFTGEECVALEDRFPAIFAAARRQAVAEQAKGIVAQTRPTEAEIEAKDEATLRREMTARIAAEQRTPVFQENEDYISERIVEPVLARARAERKRQADYLMRVRSEAVAPSKLTADLHARLEGNVAERRAKEGADAWGIFPSVVATALPQAVERRTCDRLVREIENTSPEVTPDAVRAVIATNPAAHRRVADSARIFQMHYATQLVATAQEKTVEAAPAADRDELRAFLAQHREAEAVVKAAERIVRREVMPKWKAARAEAALRQAHEAWPMLGNGTWYPSAELADATVSRSDYAAAVKSWRTLAGMEELAARGSAHLMEEAQTIGDGDVAAAFDRARNAIAAQNTIVDKVHPTLVEAFRAAGAGTSGALPDVQAIAARLTWMTEEKWSETREKTLWPDGKTPANAVEQHAGLFPSIRRKIELLAKAILEELKTPEEKRPEEPPPDETEPEEDPEEEMAFSISVTRTGEAVEVRLLKGKTPIYEKTAGLERVSFGAAMKEVADRLGQELKLE